MIPVKPTVLVPEPADFDKKCRQKGLAWLARNPKATRKTKRPRDLWSEFRPDLAAAFSDLCAYGAMYEPTGTVDHFKPVDADESLAYEWSNYRFASGWINSSKSKCAKVLDPFQVQAAWFEILLPSLQLVALYELIPKRLHGLVKDTIQRLHLQDDERVLRQRRKWLALYESGKLDLTGLREMAPLIAAAIEKREVETLAKRASKTR